MPGISDSISVLREQIGRHLEQVGRDTADCLLVAVSKTHPASVVKEAIDAGITDIGENKVQEASAKLAELDELLAPPGQGYKFHFIGHLQKNKVRQLLRLKPALIHSVDSYELAARINQVLEADYPQEPYCQEILIQVNTSFEDSKSGMDPAGALDEILRIAALPRLRIKGLMTVGLLSDEEVAVRAGFRSLKELFEQLKALGDERIEMKWLSMGMTDDYPLAIAEGANLLRIGSAIFGYRQYGVKE